METHAPKFLTSDAVAALLAHFPEPGFTASPTELHAAFKKAAEKYPELLGRASFGKVGAFVGSAAIEVALESLWMTGFHYRWGNALDRWALNREKLMEYYESRLRPRFEDSGIGDSVIVEAAGFLNESIHASVGADIEELLIRE